MGVGSILMLSYVNSSSFLYRKRLHLSLCWSNVKLYISQIGRVHWSYVVTIIYLLSPAFSAPHYSIFKFNCHSSLQIYEHLPPIFPFILHSPNKKGSK